MSTQAAIYDLTLFDKDGNVLWGATSGGSITESSFQTPDPDKSHDRPWLLPPTNFDGPSVDFVRGSSRIGSVTAPVLDVRKTSTDQTTGTLTEKIKQAVGGRAVLRRWDATNTQWLVLMDGLVHTYSVDDDLVVYNFHLRDGREFERTGELFSSNFVLFGAAGQQGPPIDYGELPVGGEYLLRGVGGFQSTRTFNLVATGSDPTDGIFYGFAATSGPGEQGAGQLQSHAHPVQGGDGLFYYQDVRIQWRPQGSTDEWTTLSNMPRSDPLSLIKGSWEQTADDPTLVYPTIYFASTTRSDLPDDGESIEYRVLAEEITEDTPFFWDGGTLGDLLQEIVDGDHSDTTPQERYDSTALASFRTDSPKARFILKEPVTDRRKWVEENIYQPAGVAPSFTASQEIQFVDWRLPDDTESIPVIDADDLTPLGEWEHGTGTAVGRIEYTYIREHLDPLDTIVETRTSGWWFWKDTITEQVVDPDDERAPWQRLTETEIKVTQEDDDAIPGAKTLTYRPTTIRSIGEKSGAPMTGDGRDELGRRLSDDAFDTIFPRFRSGAPTYRANVRAIDANLGLEIGDWVRLRAEWLPEYSTGLRGARRYMQIYSISDIDPAHRELFLVDGGVPDPDGDDTVGDCLSGGTSTAAPGGKTVIEFTSDGNLQNTCGNTVTVPQILLVGAGEAGESDGTGGGGGEGLLLEDVEIAANETIPITIGDGGSTAEANGEDTVLWLDTDGTALDPDNDTAPSEYTACGGGQPAQGSANCGEFSRGNAVTASCDEGSVTGGAGGAGTTGDGGGGTADGGTCTSTGGAGGPGKAFTDFGVTVGDGGGGFGTETDLPSGVYPGGGGTGEGGASGKGGYAAALHDSVPTMVVPTISSTSTTDQNQVEACITETDFQAATPAGYKVRFEYAIGDSEPSASSGDWQFMGALTEDGCVTSDPVPTGATVWVRARAESEEYRPTAWTSSEQVDTPETAGLLALSLSLDGDIATLAWTANAFADIVRIRGSAHDAEDDMSPDLALIDDVWARLGSHELSDDSVTEGRWLTVDVESWTAKSYDTIALADSPLAYLRLGESSGTTAEDETANNNDGTYHGSPTLGETGLLTEDDDTAVTFDGSDDDVSVSGVAALGSDATRSLVMWLETTESGQTRIFGVRNSGDSTIWQVSLNRDADGTSQAGRTTIQALDSAGDIYNESLDEDIYDGATHMLAVVQDGHTDWRIYVDGVEVTPSNTFSSGTYDTPSNWDVEPMFGARNNQGTAADHTAATIDEVALYASALTATQVAQQYDAGARTGTVEATDTLDAEGDTDRVTIEHVDAGLATDDDVDGADDNLLLDNDLEPMLDNNLNKMRYP